MKLSVSLPEEEVLYLDRYAHEYGLESRSAALLKAVRLMRTAELGAAYEAAWDEWQASGDAEAWEPTAGDGLAR